jgi:hypothetical protein
LIPNYRLDLNDNYFNSINILKNSILNSSFPEFVFIIENHKFINFFNTKEHPTHYLLFLQCQAIVNKIANNQQSINVNSYYDINNRNYFKKFYTVFLPGKDMITEDISKKTGILLNADYYDWDTDEYLEYQDKYFDWNFYINNNNDLNCFKTKLEAINHWNTYGKYENRLHKYNI